jgi:hypothetical protein
MKDKRPILKENLIKMHGFSLKAQTSNFNLAVAAFNQAQSSLEDKTTETHMKTINLSQAALHSLT